MKKSTIFLFAVFMSSIAFGQWSVGPRLGVNFSTLTGKWSDDDDSKTRWIGGPLFGAAVSYAFSEEFTLTSELQYITTGHKAIFDYGVEKARNVAENENYSIRQRYNSFQWTALAKAVFGKGSFKYFAYVGPFITQKFGGKWKDDRGNSGKIKWGDADDNPDSDDDTWYIDPKNFRRFDTGVYLGGGAGRKLGPGSLDLDLRIGFGFLDMVKFDSKEDKKDARDNGYKPHKNVNISLGLVYMISLDKK